MRDDWDVVGRRHRDDAARLGGDLGRSGEVWGGLGRYGVGRSCTSSPSSSEEESAWARKARKARVGPGVLPSTLKTTRHGRASARHRTPPRGVELAAAPGLGGLVSAHLSGAISADLG